MIVEANGKFYTTTHHADLRSLELDISIGEIQKVLQLADPIDGENGNTVYKYKLGTRVLVVVISADDERIVTTFEV
jgi:hypothetical protein